MVAVRLAREADLPFILRISNRAAAETTANFAVEPESLEAWRSDFAATRAFFPWFVAPDDRDEVVGFAKAGPWKGRCAYAFSVEVAVYVLPEHHRRGIGRALYARLLETVEAQGYRSAIGGIAQPNEPSVKLHESFGMRRVALFERIGWKFDRWHDVGYWQVEFHPREPPPERIRPVSEIVAV